MSMDRSLASSDSNSFLRVENLWIRKGSFRGYKWIVKGVSFEVSQGEFVAIIGPNGAGKTKLLESIVGDRPFAGKVALFGQNLYNDPEHWLQQIGWVPSYNVLHDGLKAEQALIQIGRLRLPHGNEAEIRHRVTTLLDHLEIPEARRQALIRQLSSGERKRLDLCAELLTNPPLLLLDEPTTNLDPDAERYLMELLRNRSWGKRQSVVVVTHTLQSLYLCDRVLFLAKGKVRAEGSYIQVLDQLERQLNDSSNDHDSGVPRSQPLGVPRISEVNGSQELTQDDASRWAVIYRKSKVYENEPEPDPPEKAMIREESGSDEVKSRPKNWIHELRVLLKRNWLLYTNNMTALGLFLLLGPFSGLLSRVVLRDNAFVPDSDVSGYSAVFDTTDARQAVFIIALVVTLLGLIASFLEVTRERPIYQYERIKGLSPWAYLLSKWIVLAILVGILAPSFLMVVLTFQGQVMPSPLFVLITLYLACIAAITLGLAISATSNSERIATGLLGIVVVFHLFFSGGVDFNERFRAFLERISVFAASHWAAEGISTSIQLYCWASNPRFQDFSSLGHLVSIWLYLVVYMLLAMILALAALLLQDAWFARRQRLLKIATNVHIWSLIPLALIAFSWGFFFKIRSQDYFQLHEEQDNVRIAAIGDRDLFQSVNGYISQSQCPVPTPLPPPEMPVISIPITPTAQATLEQVKPPTPTPLPDFDTFATQVASIGGEDFLPLPIGSLLQGTKILFGPKHEHIPLETLPDGASLVLLGKDRFGDWLRVKEQYTGRDLVGWVPQASTDFSPTQTGSVASPPSCAIPRAYLENDAPAPTVDWISDVSGHVVVVVDLFRDEAGLMVTTGELLITVDDRLVDSYPLNPTRHSFLFRGLVVEISIEETARMQFLLKDVQLEDEFLHIRVSIFFVPDRCSF